MTTTLQTARRAINNLVMPGSRVHSTTTNITTNNYVLDSKLPGLGFSTDDDLNGKWLFLNTTANANVERKISDYTATTGTITLPGADLAAESGSQEFEVSRFAATDVMNALNRAMNSEYKYTWHEIEDETIITRPNQTVYDKPSGIDSISEIYLENYSGVDFDENILSDYGDFESWTTATQPAGTDAATNLTLSKMSSSTESQEPHITFSDHAVKAVVAATTAGTHYFTAISNYADLDSTSTVFTMKVYCTTSSRVRLVISDTNAVGNTLTYSDYHGGTGWQRMTVSRTHVSGLTEVKPGIAVASGATALTFYYDEAEWTITGRGVEDRWEKLYNWSIYDSKIRFPSSLPEQRLLRLVGKTPLTAFATDAGTTELNEPQVQILYYSALVYLFRQLRSTQTGKTQNPYDDDINYWEMELRKARSRYGMVSPISSPIDGYWR